MPYYPGKQREIEDEELDAELDQAPYDSISNKPPAEIPNEAMSVRDTIAQKFGLADKARYQNEANTAANLGQAFQSFSRGVNAPVSNDALYENMAKQSAGNIAMVDADEARSQRVKEAIANREMKSQEMAQQKARDEQASKDRRYAVDSASAARRKEPGQIKEPKPDIEMAMRKEWETNQTTQDTQKLDRGIKVLRSVKDTPAGHLSFIYNYMKMLDPGSTVREGEFATAAKAGTFGDKISNAVAKVSSGKMLTPEQLANFRDEAEGIYSGQLTSQKDVDDYYRGIAQNNGFRPEAVVRGFQSGQAPESKQEKTYADLVLDNLMPNASAGGGRFAIKKGYNPSTNKTQLIYNDGSKETVNGKK